MTRSDPAAAGTAALDYSLELPLLGVPTLFRSNSPAVIAAAEAALGPWRELPQELVDPGPPLLVEILLHPGQSRRGADGRPEFALRAHGDTVLAASGDCILSATLDQGRALAFVTPDLAADGPGLRGAVIERLGLLLATRRDRAPIQAAAVVRGGLAILLAGPSGADRSALCAACVGAGFQLLADDVVYLSLGRGLRLWGNPAPGQLPPGRLARHCERAVVCVVERRPGQASRLAPLPPGEAAPALPGAGAYRLSAGDPASAVALLATLAGE